MRLKLCVRSKKTKSFGKDLRSPRPQARGKCGAPDGKPTDLAKRLQAVGGCKDSRFARRWRCCTTVASRGLVAVGYLPVSIGSTVVGPIAKDAGPCGGCGSECH